jgi:hypothetical protein
MLGQKIEVPGKKVLVTMVTMLLEVVMMVMVPGLSRPPKQI